MENLKSLDVPDSGKLKKLGIIDYGIQSEPGTRQLFTFGTSGSAKTC